MVKTVFNETGLTLVLLLAAFLFVLTGCTSPSHDGVQSHFEGSLPVDGKLIFN